MYASTGIAHVASMDMLCDLPAASCGTEEVTGSGNKVVVVRHIA
jgi:hypothetical protein